MIGNRVTHRRRFRQGSLVLVAMTLVTLGFAQPAAAQINLPFAKKPTEAEPKPVADPTRVVAIVNGQEITRDELAAELIEAYGKEHLESMIGRVLVQQQCKSQNIEVTEDDVRQELNNILKRNNLKLEEFRSQVLASQNMTIGQYLRDQVWPRLALIRLVEGKVKVDDEDLHKAFVANFGEKVELRMLTVVERRKAEEIWKTVTEQTDAEERVKTFEDLARRFSTDEATRPYGGKAAPIGRHSVNPAIEEAAFALEPGELGSIMQVPGGHLIILCVRKIPARADVTLDSLVDAESLGPNPPEGVKTYRDLLVKDIHHKKVLQEVGNFYQAVEDGAQIENFLTGDFDVDSIAGPPAPPTNRAGN